MVKGQEAWDAWTLSKQAAMGMPKNDYLVHYFATRVSVSA